MSSQKRIVEDVDTSLPEKSKKVKVIENQLLSKLSISTESISYSIKKCCLGLALVACSKRGICFIGLGSKENYLVERLQHTFPSSEVLVSHASSTETLFSKAFECIDNPSLIPKSSLPLDIQGTPFQEKVWDQLLQIPLGKTISYSELATSIGSPKGARAAALACGANKIAVLIPCHRVVRSNGDLSGYEWGVEKKALLLQKEKKLLSESLTTEN